MTTAKIGRIYAISLDRVTIRRVTHPTTDPNQSYYHDAEVAVIEQVAWHLEENTTPAGPKTTRGKIKAAEGLAWSQLDVALTFLRDNGLINVERREIWTAHHNLVDLARLRIYNLRQDRFVSLD